MSEILRAVREHLSTGCEIVEAGFYFESGGCFGMALALHEVLNEAGIESRLATWTDHRHAFVVVGTSRFDYRGEMFHSDEPFQEFTIPRFVEVVKQEGHTEDDLAMAKDWAKSAIESASALALDETRRPRP